MTKTDFLAAFCVPKVALGVVDEMVTDAEQHFVAEMAGRTFTARTAARLVSKLRGQTTPLAQVKALLYGAYKRGILNLVERGKYVVADFFVRLDVFCVTEPETYARFPNRTQEALNALYLQRYIEEFGGMNGRFTQDEVVPLEVLVARIETDERPLYLSPCDCRALAGGGEWMVCLSYRTAPGSYASRGVSRPVTRQEAVKVLLQADREGLIHTANPDGGICNCHVDYCYLFCAQKKLGSCGRWPLVRHKAVLEKKKCTHCGRCVGRCPFGLLVEKGKELVYDKNRCVGCGLCVNTCPTGALFLEPWDIGREDEGVAIEPGN